MSTSDHSATNDEPVDSPKKETLLENSKTPDLGGESSSVGEKNPEKKLPAIKKEAKFTYRDYSHIEATHAQPGTMSPSSSAIRVQKLPAKLNAMLSNPEYTHIISWMPHGRSWKVHNPHAFVEEVIPKYFEYTNYNSFVRLVNAWGFRRITKGPDRNSYYHELFLRGMPHLHSKMHRLTANEKKLPVDPEDEPDFYKISAHCPLPPVSQVPKGMGMAQGMTPGAPRQQQLREQMMAKQMGGMAGLGMGAGLGGAGMMGAAGMMGTGYLGMGAAGMNPMMAAAQLEEEEMMAAGMPSLQQQRADLLAANQAFELQAARLREQERRLAYLQGASNPAAAGGLGAAAGLGAGLGYPPMGRLGRGMGMPNSMGMFPEDMMSDPTGGLGQMTPSMMARLQQQPAGPKQSYPPMNRF